MFTWLPYPFLLFSLCRSVTNLQRTLYKVREFGSRVPSLYVYPHYPFKSQWLVYTPLRLTLKNSTFSPQNAFRCTYYSQNKQSTSFYSINWLVYCNRDCVFPTEYFTTINCNLKFEGLSLFNTEDSHNFSSNYSAQLLCLINVYFPVRDTY